MAHTVQNKLSLTLTAVLKDILYSHIHNNISTTSQNTAQTNKNDSFSTVHCLSVPCYIDTFSFLKSQAWQELCLQGQTPLATDHMLGLECVLNRSRLWVQPYWCGRLDYQAPLASWCWVRWSDIPADQWQRDPINFKFGRDRWDTCRAAEGQWRSLWQHRDTFQFKNKSKFFWEGIYCWMGKILLEFSHDVILMTPGSERERCLNMNHFDITTGKTVLPWLYFS